jgi:hypothetical protein
VEGERLTPDPISFEGIHSMCDAVGEAAPKNSVGRDDEAQALHAKQFSPLPKKGVHVTIAHPGSS